MTCSIIKKTTLCALIALCFNHAIFSMETNEQQPSTLEKIALIETLNTTIIKIAQIAKQKQFTQNDLQSIQALLPTMQKSFTALTYNCNDAAIEQLLQNATSASSSLEIQPATLKEILILLQQNLLSITLQIKAMEEDSTPLLTPSLKTTLEKTIYSIGIIAIAHANIPLLNCFDTPLYAYALYQLYTTHKNNLPSAADLKRHVEALPGYTQMLPSYHDVVEFFNNFSHAINIHPYVNFFGNTEEITEEAEN